MNPDIWGNHAWRFLHAVAHTYPEDPTDTDKEHYAELYMSLQYTLPCPVCQEHYRDIVKTHPIQLDSRTELEHWLMDIHNQVNRQLGQDEYSYSEIRTQLLFIAPNTSAQLWAITTLLVYFIGQYLLSDK